MITREEVIALFSDKLDRTGSLDDALWKACWVSWLDGHKDGSTEQQPIQPKWSKNEQVDANSGS